MAESNYSKREMDLVLKRIEENIAELSQFTKEGFKGVHDRQDKTNGNVAKNTEFRQQMTGGLTLVKVIGIGNLLAWGAVIIELFK
jgi:hypothetical protein